ncbi:MAG: hypothetical protein ACXWQO_17695, partial [Bdellovibrionota bacterium]
MKPMSMLLSLLGFALFTAMAHADAIYTCENDRGDTVRITFTREGQRMSLRSRYAGLNLTKSKRSPAD